MLRREFEPETSITKIRSVLREPTYSVKCLNKSEGWRCRCRSSRRWRGVSCWVVGRGSEGKSRLRNVEIHSPNDTASHSTRPDSLTETQISQMWEFVVTLCTLYGRVRLKCDGTWWRTAGEAKGKLVNGVGSQYPSHYLGTWCIQHYYRWCAHLGCQ